MYPKEESRPKENARRLSRRALRNLRTEMLRSHAIFPASCAEAEQDAHAQQHQSPRGRLRQTHRSCGVVVGPQLARV